MLKISSNLKRGLILLTMMMAFALCSYALAQSDSPSEPEPLILTDEQGSYHLGLYLEILEDPSGELTIDDVSSPEFEARFTPSQQVVPNYGFTDSVYWVRFRLDNQTHQTDEWLLEQGFANTQFIDLYTPLPDGGGFSVKQTGVLRPPSTRDIPYPLIVLNLTIPPESQNTFYSRFQNGAAMTLSLTLWTKDAFLVNSQTVQVIQGLFYGILIGLLTYNIFLLVFSFREASSLYYVTFLASFIFFLASYDGYTQLYFLPDQFSLTQYYIPLSWALTFISTVLFANDFLKIKSHFQRLYWGSIVILGVWVFLFFLTPFTSYHVLTLLMVPWALLSLVVVFIAMIFSLQMGFKAVRFFLIAWFGLLVTLSMVILVRLGVLPSTIFSENAFRLGLVWMAVCWSIALADRFNLLKSEKDRANLELQASETRYRHLVETMNDGLGVIDLDNRFTYVNPRLAEMLAYSPDELIGHSLTEFIDEDNQQVLHSQLEKRKTGRSDPYELAWLKKDGSEVIAQMSPMPLYENNGRFQGSFAVITDITERVLAGRLLEQRVEERTRELSAMLDISRGISSDQELDVILHRILERLNSVVNYHGVVILAEQDDKWITSAQDWPFLTDQPEPVEFSALEVQGIVNHFAPGEPVLINNSHLDETNVNGFGTIVARLSRTSDPGIPCWLGMPLLEKGNIIGIMVIGCTEADASQDQVNIIEAFTNQVAIAIENNRLYQQIREAVMVDERNRLARDLHDSVTQTLFTASVLAEATPRIWDREPAIARQNLDKLSLLIRGALAEMRSMLIELRSGELQNQTLNQLLQTVVEAAQGRSRATFNTSISDVPELPKKVTLAFYRIGREALNNVIVHAGASQVDISLVEEQGQVELRIQDNGCGFDPQSVQAGHLGIKIMFERAATIGADLRIHSELGHGTEISVTWSRPNGEKIEHG